MNEPMTKYLRMGTVHFMSYPNVLADETEILPTLKKIMVDPYFSVIEITHIKNTEIRNQVRSLFENSNITLTYTTAPVQLINKLNPNSLTETVRLEAESVLRDCITEAYDLGATALGIIAGKYEEGTESLALEQLTKTCLALSDFAKSKGDLQLVIEPFDFDFFNHLLIGNSQITSQLMENLEMCGNFGVLVDLSHLPLIRETPKECFRVLGKYLKHIHVGNAVCTNPNDYLYGDLHPRFGNPNSAIKTEDVADYVRELFNIGYLGEGKRPIVSFEIKAWDDDPDIVLAECKRVMDHAWSLV